MKALTSTRERAIKMEQLRYVSKTERIIIRKDDKTVGFGKKID